MDLRDKYGGSARIRAAFRMQLDIVRLIAGGMMEYVTLCGVCGIDSSLAQYLPELYRHFSLKIVSVHCCRLDLRSK